ncbi:hypothetical protein FRC07_005371 [Ceratobasidium sp. 392]|nr:hypothetical protein FRC07_005371 [Ceratobasidium sp. 392]
MIASGSDDSTVRIWDATTGNPLLAPLRGHSSTVWTVGFSLDSRQVVSGSADRTVRIWDVKTGDPIRVLDGHSGEVNSVVFTPDGRRVISGSLDKTIRIWDVASGGDVGTYEESRPSKGHSGPVCSVAYSSDGRHQEKLKPNRVRTSATGGSGARLVYFPDSWSYCRTIPATWLYQAQPFQKKAAGHHQSRRLGRARAA